MGAIERALVRMIPSVQISDVRRVVLIWVMKKTSLKILFLEKKEVKTEGIDLSLLPDVCCSS